MPHARLTIAPKGDKGRIFAADLLAYLQADFLWENGGNGQGTRPVWMVLASSEHEMRAFVANLLSGRPAERGGRYSRATDRFEILKSAGYLRYSKRIGNGVVTTFLLPDLFRIDPGMVDPSGIRFCVLPAKAWVAAQRFDLEAARRRLLDLADVSEADIHELVRTYNPRGSLLTPLLSDDGLHLLLSEGSLLLAYLDRRCRFPILFDPVFGAWLALVTQYRNLLVRKDPNNYRSPYEIHGADDVNVHKGFAFMSTHEAFGEVLSEELQRWYHGSHR